MDEVVDLELEKPGITAWEGWKKNPNPLTLSHAVRSVNPVIQSTVKRFPNFNSAVMGGEAKRLAIQAIKTYDPASGTQLSTHVMNHLRPMSRFAQSASRAVNVPRESREAVGRLKSFEKSFLEENGREPTDSDILEGLGINRKKLQKLNQLSRFEFAEGQVETMPDVTQDEDPTLGMWFDYVYNDLNDRDRLIVDMKMGRNGRTPMSSDQIAARLKMHPSYINRRAQEIANKIVEGTRSSMKS